MLLVNPGNLFSVHQESGALSLTRSVDYESGHNLHTLQVRASEADTSLSSVAEVRRVARQPIAPMSQRRDLILIFNIILKNI